MHHNPPLFLVLLALFAGSGTIVRAQEEGAKPGPAPSEITPSYPFQRVALIRAELELIRLAMGKPQVERRLFEVKDAAPREVYFQALILFRKADRLAFEQIRERVKEPPIPSGTIVPNDVFEMLGTALGQIRRAKAFLEIDEKLKPPALVPDVRPSQVFAAIVEANREINGLLDQRFSPSEVFQEVTVAIAYAARLLDAFGGINAPPEAPPFEAQMRPADVNRRLLQCFEKIRRVGEISNVPMLRLELNDAEIEKAEPSDVYDIASLLVSELIHLHSLLPDAGKPRESYNPGRKVPSHVYQRAGVLLEQLNTLNAQAEQNPGWLGNQDGSPTVMP